MISAAIHIGSERSCYAFSTRDGPERISTNYNWRGLNGSPSYFTSTCILVNPKKQFDSFGFDAEEKYSNLTKESKHHGWLLFHNFATAFGKLEVIFFFLNCAKQSAHKT